MPFDEKGFAADIVEHLGMVKNDMETLKGLRSKDRKSVMAKAFNLMIDIKNVPEFVEAWAFAYAVDMIEGFFKKQMGK